MTCHNCNAELAPDAKSCPQCGAAIPNGEPTQEAEAAASHPYHRLGGFLKVLAVVCNIGRTLSAVCVIGLIGMILVELIGKGSYTIFNFRWLLAAGFNLWYSHRINMQIRFRDPIFLFTFQKYTMIRLAVLFLFIWIDLGVLYAVIVLLAATLSFLLVNLYYIKSVRVRTYMENEGYLRLSVFNKETDSPEPADGAEVWPEHIEE